MPSLAGGVVAMSSTNGRYVATAQFPVSTGAVVAGVLVARATTVAVTAARSVLNLRWVVLSRAAACVRVSDLQVASVCGLLLLLTACEERQGSWQKHMFNVAAWAETPDKDRYVLVRDLIEGKYLLGKSQYEVEAMLGRPSSRVPIGHSITYLVKLGSR